METFISSLLGCLAQRVWLTLCLSTYLFVISWLFQETQPAQSLCDVYLDLQVQTDNLRWQKSQKQSQQKKYSFNMLKWRIITVGGLSHRWDADQVFTHTVMGRHPNECKVGLKCLWWNFRKLLTKKSATIALWTILYYWKQNKTKHRSAVWSVYEKNKKATIQFWKAPLSYSICLHRRSLTSARQLSSFVESWKVPDFNWILL